jgi:hypothetical protein
MQYVLGNMLNGGGINPDGLSLDLQFAADKTFSKPSSLAAGETAITSRRGPSATFLRSSAATEVGPDGLIRYAPENLAIRSETLDDATWSKSNATVVANQSTAPDGTLTADSLIKSLAFGNVRQQVTASNGTYTASIYLKSGTETNGSFAISENATATILSRASINLQTGVITNSTGTTVAVDVGNGWWRVSSTITNTTDTNVSIIVYSGIFSGTEVGNIYAWGAQLERHTSARAYIPTTTAVVYGPRFDHDPVTLACRGLLIEEGRTNVCLRSEEFNESAWSKSGSIAAPPTVTANQVNSPSGVLSADRIAFPAVSGAGAYSLAAQSIALTSGSVYTASIYLRGLNGGEKVWWSWTPNGVTYARKECVLTTSWQRFDVTFTASAVANFIQIGVDLRDASQSAQSAQTIFAWGAQLEVGSFATSYIPTTTGTLARGADVCNITGGNFNNFYNQSEGTILASSSCFAPQPTAIPSRRVVAATDGTTGNRVSISNVAVGFITPGLSQAFVVFAGGSLQSDIGITGLTLSSLNKTAAAYKENDFAVSTNSSAVVTDASASVPTNLNRLDIGTQISDGFLCGHIAAIRYYKKRLPNAKLAQLTV